MFAAATKGWALLLCAVPIGLNSCTMADKIHRATECTRKPLMSKPTASPLLIKASLPYSKIHGNVQGGGEYKPVCIFRELHMCCTQPPHGAKESILLKYYIIKEFEPYIFPLVLQVFTFIAFKKLSLDASEDRNSMSEMRFGI